MEADQLWWYVLRHRWSTLLGETKVAQCRTTGDVFLLPGHSPHLSLPRASTLGAMLIRAPPCEAWGGTGPRKKRSIAQELGNPRHPMPEPAITHASVWRHGLVQVLARKYTVTWSKPQHPMPPCWALHLCVKEMGVNQCRTQCGGTGHWGFPEPHASTQWCIWPFPAYGDLPWRSQGRSP